MLTLARSITRIMAIIWICRRHDILADVRRWPYGWLAFPLRPWWRKKYKRLGLRLVDIGQDLGPGFIKLGQMLATRGDIIGPDIARDLTLLQDRLDPFSGRQAKQIIEDSLGQPIQTLFRHFEAKAVAAASIAQVHRATTTNGRDVAVKVLRPGIRRAFKRDLALFRSLVWLTKKFYGGATRLHLDQTLNTLECIVNDEMDLRLEAAAASELSQHCTDFLIPDIDWGKTSADVMTSTWMDGNRIDHIKPTPDQPSRALLVERCLKGYFSQVFERGFFHADLHPGNILVNPSGQIILLDFGIMGRIDQHQRAFMAEIFIAILRRDYARVTDIHFAAGYIDKNQDRNRFIRICRAIGEPIIHKPLADISLADLLSQLIAVFAAFNMPLQPQLLLLQKSLLMIEGLARSIAPKTNIFNLIKPSLDAWEKNHQRLDSRAKAFVTHYQPLFERAPIALLGAFNNLEQATHHGLRLDQKTIAQINRHRWRWLSWECALTLMIGFIICFMMLD